MGVGVGKGTLYLMLSQVVFVIAGYAIHFGLGRYMGPDEYGIFGIVLSLITTINLILTSGIPTASSKFISEDNKRFWSIMRKTRNIEIILAIIVFTIYLSLSSVIAEYIFNDPSLAPYIAFSSLAIPAYALYSIYTSYLNGLRFFGKQAKTQIIHSIIKVSIAFLFVILGFGIYGAITGYIFASVVTFVILSYYISKLKLEKDSRPFDGRKIVEFAFPAAFLSIVLTLLLNIGLFSVKSILGSNTLAGYYTSANTISMMLFYISGALGVTLLPSISMSTSNANEKLTRQYIETSIRYLLMILVPIVVIISATATSTIIFTYSSEYVNAAETLSILVFGIFFLAIINVLNSIIIGTGKPKDALMMNCTILIISAILNFLLIPHLGIEGAAIATTVSGSIGVIMITIYSLKNYKAVVRPISFLKILASSILIFFVAYSTPVPIILLPILYIILLIVYFAILIALKEFTKEDFDTIRQILKPN